MRQVNVTESVEPAAVAAPRRTPRWLVITVACVFAALLPETVLTSSTPVAAIIVNFPAVIYLSVFYGTFMLIVREVIIRRPASWVSVVLLGIAFGFCNEGVVAGTWYKVLEHGYLFFGPVNYAWAVGLTVFHTFISVMLTVAFTDVLFPTRAGQPLLGRRGIAIAALLFLLCNAPFVFAPTFRVERGIAFVAALVLAAIALRLPPARRAAATAAPPRLWTLRFAGFFGYLLYFLFLYLVPVIVAGLPGVSLVVAQYIDITLMVGFAALVLARGVSWRRRGGWGLRHNLALITGVVAFEVPITILVPSQAVLLEPVATVPMFLFLVWRAGQLPRRERAVATVAAPANGK